MVDLNNKLTDLSTSLKIHLSARFQVPADISALSFKIYWKVFIEDTGQ